MPATSDLQLITQLRLGQQKAVSTWYYLYQKRLRRFVASRLQNSGDIEEIVQETFINCLHNLPNFQGKSSLWTWMCAIARHEIGDYYRKRYAKKVLQLLPLGDWLLGDFLHSDHNCQNFTHQLQTADLSEKIDCIWQKIGHYYRELLLEKYLDRLSVVQLARARGKTPKAIESDLFRARAAFKAAYQEIERALQ